MDIQSEGSFPSKLMVYRIYNQGLWIAKLEGRIIFKMGGKLQIHCHMEVVKSLYYGGHYRKRP